VILRMLASSVAPDPDLARMLGLVQQVVPGLCGTQGTQALPGALRCGDEAALRALCRHWAAAHPEAGAHYLALRCWGLAIWQPVYLSVIAAQLDTHVPHLAGLAQPVAEGFPSGFQLPAHAPVAASPFERMDAAATELRAFCDSMRAALADCVALHLRAADRLQAECVLGALLRVHRHAPACSGHELAALGAAWLARLGIAGGCGFLAYRARDGTPALALDRKVCCHHFRRRDGEKCSTCPKLPLDTRIARLLADS
jgi:siderophore ferric iron reductase